MQHNKKDFINCNVFMELCELESKTDLVIFFLFLQIENLQDLNTRFIKEAENEDTKKCVWSNTTKNLRPSE